MEKLEFKTNIICDDGFTSFIYHTAIECNRIDLMVDIETFGTDSEAFVFQISAIPFNLETGKIYHDQCFNQIVDIETVDEFNVNGRTLMWWLNEDKNGLLFDLLKRGAVTDRTLFKNFLEYVDGFKSIVGFDNVNLWGNGILFDNAKIYRQMENLNIEYPIHYKCDRDVRTIVDIHGLLSGISEKELKNSVNELFRNNGIELIEHDALDDCWYQIELVKKCWKVIKYGSLVK